MALPDHQRDGAIPDIRAWAVTHAAAAKPWLILGKGPSFARVRELTTGDFWTCALNHAAREIRTDITHAIDIEVITGAGEAIEKNSAALFMPWQPHEGHRVGRRTLAQWCREIPTLERLAAANRLYWYNLTSGVPQGDAPVVEAKYFSAEAALQVSALLGARAVRSLGVDGGGDYADAFADLADRTLLSSGHSSFDPQFAGIARTIWTRQLDYRPAFAEGPIRVLIGADPTQALAERVLEHSIVRRTPRTVEFLRLPTAPPPTPRDPRNRPRTEFSFSRLRIPEICGYAGRAIYLDADMLVFRDLSELWEWDLDGKPLAAAGSGTEARRRQFSVLLLDCARLDWNLDRIVAALDDGVYDYEQLMHDFCLVRNDAVVDIPASWNSLESWSPDETRLLHYTDRHRQPWIHGKNPHGEIWYRALRDALDDGYVHIDEVHEEIRRGHVAPELPRWAGLPDCPDADGRQRDWTPPYRRALGRWEWIKATLPGPVRSRVGWAVNQLRRRLRR